MNIPNSFLKRSGKDIIVRGERGSSRKNYGCIRKYMHLALDSLSKREARSYNYIDKLYSNYIKRKLSSYMYKKENLRVYSKLKEDSECKQKYLFGIPDLGSMVIFKFRSGTHGLNEELHGNGNRKKSCVFCNFECENMQFGNAYASYSTFRDVFLHRF